MSFSYNAGFGLGIVVGLVLVIAVLLYKWKKDGAFRYDERQIMGRGKAYRAGFVVSLGSNLLYAVVNHLYSLPGDAYLWQIGCMELSVLAFVLTAIHYDAYLSLTEKPEKLLLSGSLLALSCGLSGIINLNHTAGILSLTVAGMWVIVLAAYGIHIAADRKAQDDE